MNRNLFLALSAVLVGGVVLVSGCHKAGADESDDSGDVATLVTVQVGQLRQATLHAYISGYGVVQPAPASGDSPAAVAEVAPSQPGVVTRVYVTAGEHVNQGARLVDLDDRAAQVDVKYAAQTAQREKTLYAQHNTSLKALQVAEAALATAQAKLALFHITAPLAGTVTSIAVEPGAAVDLTTKVAEITDLKRLVIAADIPADDAAALKVGEPIELGGSSPVATTLAYVSPTVDPANGTVKVLAAVPASAGLRSGMLAPLRITTGEHANVLAAPADSVVTTEDGETVVSVVNTNEATQIPVKTGYHEDGLVEISGPGLKPGQTVVTVGAYGLPAKTQVQVAQR